MSDTSYQYRQIARITVEAVTPLSVGSGESDIMTDALVIKDVNGMPYIPATSIAGVVRHSLAEQGIKTDQLFGFQGFNKNEGCGSKIIFTDAVMIGKEGLPLDGIQRIDMQDEFYSHFVTLPIRQHVRINRRGTAEDKGKFDEQVTFKGVRFVFEMELVDNRENNENFASILKVVHSPWFRIGSGTRSGFGSMKVVECRQAVLDLGNEQDLNLYLTKSSCLSSEWNGFKQGKSLYTEDEKRWINYSLELKPRDFFLFSSGFGDDDADMTPTEELFIIWKDGKPEFKTAYVIPASSIKGAIAHRTAYHWNKKKEHFADKEYTETVNEAVKTLFGNAGDNEEDIARGNVIIDDILIETSDKVEDYKFFNHIAIDRFTGGVMDGALFTEKTTYLKNTPISLKIFVAEKALEDEDVKFAFEKTLEDISNGLLPLGGGTSRGHGIFKKQ